MTALEAQHRLDGEPTVQEVDDALANIHVTEAENNDPARVVQKLRLIFVELGSLGDVVSQDARVLQSTP